MYGFHGKRAFQDHLEELGCYAFAFACQEARNNAEAPIGYDRGHTLPVATVFLGFPIFENQVDRLQIDQQGLYSDLVRQ